MESGQNSKVISLDAPTYTSDNSGGHEPSLLDHIGTNHKEELLLKKETLKQAILKLNSRQRRIIYLRFYGGLSQSEIAERMQLSQMHISRLLTKSIRSLKDELAKQ